MHLNLRQLRLAILLAIGFVGLRIVYALIFAGARSGEIVLLHLPEISLIGPFRHIVLLGDFTLEGAVANLQTALPFALAIICFGLLSSLIAPKHFFSAAKKYPWAKNLLLAMGIAWAQLPALLDGINRAKFALSLRREKPAKLLIPVLEIAASRALAIAARLSIESLETAPKPNIEIDNLEVSGVRVKSLTLKPGSLSVITGPTASGKSSFLLSLSGLGADLGLEFSGWVRTVGSIGFVAQQPRDSIWGPTVSDEFTAAPESRFAAIGERLVSELSEGEAVLLTFEREMSRNPQILLLDEPFASLDEAAAARVANEIGEFTKRGGIAVVVEHRPEHLLPFSPQLLQISAGQLVDGRFSQSSARQHREIAVVGSDVVFDLVTESVNRGAKELVGPSRLVIRQGQAVSITGPNGSGKTSLLKQLALGQHKLEIAMVPEVVSDFFVTQSLELEFARADKLSGVEAGFTQRSFDSICTDLKIASSTHPRDLSHGTQLALAIAMQMSHKPKMLIIDEPVKGFDSRTKQNVAETLRCVLETGTAVLFATHDAEFARDLQSVEYRIDGGQLRQLGEVYQ